MHPPNPWALFLGVFSSLFLGTKLPQPDALLYWAEIVQLTNSLDTGEKRQEECTTMDSKYDRSVMKQLHRKGF